MTEIKKCVTEKGKRIKGQAHLLRHLDGKALSRSQAILAKCYDCMGYYADGPEDCRIIACPLYRFMPFSARKGQPVKSEKTGSPENQKDGSSEGSSLG